MLVKQVSPISSFDGFSQGGKAVLHFLNDRIGMGLWLITRVRGDEWLVLQSVDHDYQVSDGQTMKWSDSLCSRMVNHLAPRIAADVANVPAYSDCPIRGICRACYGDESKSFLN